MGLKRSTRILASAAIWLAATPSVWATEQIDASRVLQLVRSKNKAVKSAEIEQRLAEIKHRVALSYGLPSLSLSAEAARTNLLGDIVPGAAVMLPVIDRTTGGSTNFIVPSAGFEIGSNREGNIFQTKASLQWTVYAGGRFWAALEIAELAKQDSQYVIAEALDDAIYQAMKAYADTLLAESALEVMAESKSLSESHVGRVGDLFHSGFASQLDLLIAESRSAELEAALIEAQNRVTLAKDLLTLLLGLEVGTKLELLPYTSEVNIPTDSADVLAEVAISRRPEVASLNIKQAMLDETKKLAIGKYIPSVTLIGDYSFKYGTQFPPSENEWINGWTVGVGANWVLFDGLKGLAERDEAALKLEQLVIGRERLVDGIRMEVTSALRQLQTATKIQAVRWEHISRVQKQFDSATERFKNGLASNLDVLDAQLALTTARLAAKTADHAVAINLLELELKTGSIQNMGTK